MRRMENGAGGQRSLMTTTMTLVKPPRQSATGGVAAVGALEPSGPAMLEKSVLAFGLCAVLF